MSRKAMQMALDFVQRVTSWEGGNSNYSGKPDRHDVLTALRAALAEQPAAPVVPERVNNSEGVTQCLVKWQVELPSGRWLGAWDKESFDEYAALVAAIHPGHCVVPAGEIEALRKDAERYRWLRDNGQRSFELKVTTPNDDGEYEHALWGPMASEYFNAAIDAAIAARLGEKHE